MIHDILILRCMMLIHKWCWYIKDGRCMLLIHKRWEVGNLQLTLRLILLLTAGGTSLLGITSSSSSSSSSTTSTTRPTSDYLTSKVWYLRQPGDAEVSPHLTSPHLGNVQQLPLNLQRNIWPSPKSHIWSNICSPFQRLLFYHPSPHVFEFCSLRIKVQD